MLTQPMVAMIETALARALATSGPHGVNVVPVSVLKVESDKVYLYNFFMGKTVENIAVQPLVALTCWQGLEGIQIKAIAEYVSGGPMFESAVEEMKMRFPDRTLKGVIVVIPTAVYDISADAARAGVELAS